MRNANKESEMRPRKVAVQGKPVSFFCTHCRSCWEAGIKSGEEHSFAFSNLLSRRRRSRVPLVDLLSQHQRTVQDCSSRDEGLCVLDADHQFESSVNLVVMRASEKCHTALHARLPSPDGSQGRCCWKSVRSSSSRIIARNVSRKMPACRSKSFVRFMVSLFAVTLQGVAVDWYFRPEFIFFWFRVHFGWHIGGQRLAFLDILEVNGRVSGRTMKTRYCRKLREKL